MKHLLVLLALAFPLNTANAGGLLDDFFDDSEIESVADAFSEGIDDVADEVSDACEDNPTVCINNAAFVFDSFFAFLASLFSFLQQALAQIATTPIFFVLPA
jgi:hypothetical protein